MHYEGTVKNYNLENASAQIRKICKRLALLHLSFSKTIIKELGNKKGKK